CGNCFVMVRHREYRMRIPIRAYWRLTRWLGPWNTADRVPWAICCRRLRLAGRQSENADTEALVYVPTDRAPIGSYLIAHGLNPQGTDDERCDRFARVLCHAGFVVMCPRLSALMQMRLDTTAITQLSTSLQALIALREHPGNKLPGIFSISFGSYPALMTAASPEVGHLVGSLIVFGGDANFTDTCRFLIGGSSADAAVLAPDPTCMAGIAINTAAVLFEGEQQRRLMEAWYAFVARVWGVAEMQHPERFTTAARALAAELPPELVQIFLQGCGVVPGFAAWVEEALLR